jgi:hypothetical protein
MTRGLPNLTRSNSAAAWVLLSVTLLFCCRTAIARQAEDDPPPADGASKPAPTVDEIVRRLQQRNQERDEALRVYEGTRIYRVQYHGFFGKREAEAVVRYRYVSPNTAEFTVLSQSGSRFILDHVITGLLNAEKEAATSQNRRRTALTTTNYDFTLDDLDAGSDRSQYVLNLMPRNDNKFLYRGKIWIDAKDFAVTKIEAEPARNPSFWIRKTEVRHQYLKREGFWLPAENHTESSIRGGGHAILSIEYKDYEFPGTDHPDTTESDAKNSGAPVALPAETDLH